MICLARPAASPALLCYGSGTALVFVEMRQLLTNGHWVNGIKITEPVAFPSVSTATIVGQFMRGATVVSTYDETRDQNGKLIALTPKAGVPDVFPTPRTTQIKELTYASAIAAAGLTP
jgi:hypothetical protein